MSLPEEDLPSRYPRATILTALSTAIVTFANFIPDESLRKVIIGMGPAISCVLTIGAKHIYKRYKFSNTMKVLRSWIEELEIECNEQGTTGARKTEIKAEIRKYKAELKKLQKDIISIDFN